MSLGRLKPISLSDTQDVYALTPSQEGILFECIESGDRTLYVEQIEWTFSGAVDISSFRRAWEAVCRRHEALRTRFEWRLKKPVQIVLHAAAPHIFVCEGMAAEERKAEYLSKDAQFGMALDDAPLLRIAIFKPDDGRSHVVLTTHHLVVDAWATRLLMREWVDHYEFLANGRPLSLPNPVPFRDVVRWHRQRDRTEDSHYWRQALHRRPATARQSVIGRHELAAGRQLRLERHLDATMWQRLQAAARIWRVTPAVLAYAAWAAALGLGDDRSALTMGITVSGRTATISGAEDIVGMMVNCVPLVVHLDPVQRLSDWTRQIMRDLAQAQEHQHLSLATIRQLAQVPPNADFLDSVVVFQNAGWVHGDQVGTLGVSDTRTHGYSAASLCLRLSPSHNGMLVELLWQAPLQTEQQAASLVERALSSLTCLANAATHQDVRLADMLAWRNKTMFSGSSLKTLRPQPVVDAPAARD